MSSSVKTWDIWLVTKRREPPNDRFGSFSSFDVLQVAVERGPLDPYAPPAHGALRLTTVIAQDQAGAMAAYHEELEAEKIRRRRR